MPTATLGRYGPGSYDVLAGLYRVFGEFALVERGLDVAAKTAIATFVVALVLPFGRRTVALAAGVLSSACCSISAATRHPCSPRWLPRSPWSWLSIAPRRRATRFGIYRHRPRIDDLLSSTTWAPMPSWRRGYS